MDRFTGGCLCGNVRMLASELPYRVGICALTAASIMGPCFTLPDTAQTRSM